MDNLVDTSARDLYNHILHAKATGNFCFIIGNGGSACESDHFAQDLVGKGYRAISLCNSGNITAIANDRGFVNVFADQLKVLANKGDLLITLSTSGTSPNIVAAQLVAKNMGMKVFILPTNKETGQPTASTQDIHLQIFHKAYQAL